MSGWKKSFQEGNGIGCYEFVVEDDGIGMSEPFKSKMFLPFERAEDSV